jgi:hypothetical protein
VGLNDRDRKKLWTKSGGRCSFRFKGEVCNQLLISEEYGKEIILGEECHIVDKRTSTSRYIPNFPEVDSYNNMILLCKKHHTTIDDNDKAFTIEMLQTMKKEHESSIEERLGTKEIRRIEIKDSIFKTVAKNGDEAIGMEVNQPAQLSNVRSEIETENVRRVVGFSTNQPLTSIIITCSNCGRNFPAVFTGSLPSCIICRFCSHPNEINKKF